VHGYIDKYRKAETVAKSAETNQPIEGAPLEGKIAIVTGGGRGMGRSMVLGLARAGAKVIATAARDRQELERVVAEAPRTAVLPIVADVTNTDHCAELSRNFSVSLSSAAAAIFILHRRTLYRTVRTKDAAVARLRAQQRLALGAFVEELA
jgi:NAD(P)-dependent dehydrogenase (short-subunit alcohol dehydrogenase family)